MTCLSYLLLPVLFLQLIATLTFGQGTFASDFTSSNNDQIGKVVSSMKGGIMIVFQGQNKTYWFGSKSNGVYKYDGKQLLQFTVQEGLCDDRVIGILEDKEGNIFIETRKGINKLNDTSITRLEIQQSGLFRSEWELNRNDLWFRGGWDENKVYRYDGQFLNPLQFPEHPLENISFQNDPQASFSPYGVYAIYKDRNGHIWFGTSNLGACRYDGQTIAWIYEDELTELDDGPAPGVRAIMEDKDGYFWFSNNLLNKYRVLLSNDEVGEKRLNYEIYKGLDLSTAKSLPPYFLSITEDSMGNIWMVTYDNGVWKHDGKHLEHIPVKHGNKNVLLFMIYRDRNDDLWLGTHHRGAYKYNGTTFEEFVPGMK